MFDFDTYGLPGIPDGMTIDTKGNLWVAIFDGGRVNIISSIFLLPKNEAILIVLWANSVQRSLIDVFFLSINPSGNLDKSKNRKITGNRSNSGEASNECCIWWCMPRHTVRNNGEEELERNRPSFSTTGRFGLCG